MEADKKNPKDYPTQSISKALFMPSAELIGAELKDYIQSQIDKRREVKKIQQQKNIRRRLDILSIYFSDKKIDLSENLDDTKKNMVIENLSYLPDWAEEAQDIDPDSPHTLAISDLWNKLLRGLLNGYDVKGLIPILKQLREPEAKLIEKLSEKRVSLLSENKKYERQYYFYMMELRRFGLVRHGYWRELLKFWRWPWLFVLVLPGFVLQAFLSLIFFLQIRAYDQEGFNISFENPVVLAGFFWGLFFAVGYGLLYAYKESTWCLSHKGMVLIRCAEVPKT